MGYRHEHAHKISADCKWHNIIPVLNVRWVRMQYGVDHHTRTINSISRPLQSSYLNRLFKMLKVHVCTTCLDKCLVVTLSSTI